MEKRQKSSCIYISIKTNLIYEKHIHHFNVQLTMMNDQFGKPKTITNDE